MHDVLIASTYITPTVVQLLRAGEATYGQRANRSASEQFALSAGRKRRTSVARWGMYRPISAGLGPVDATLLPMLHYRQSAAQRSQEKGGWKRILISYMFSRGVCNLSNQGIIN